MPQISHIAEYCQDYKGQARGMVFAIRIVGKPTLRVFDLMSLPNKRAMIQEILEEYGYCDWYIAEPSKLNPATSDSKCILFNFKERRKAEFMIPNEWFQDPHRYSGIRELIRLAIEYSSPAASQPGARKFFFLLPRGLELDSGDQKGYAVSDRQEPHSKKRTNT